MNIKGVVSRVLPFLATFAVGIFIASFFVSVSAPSFKSDRCRKKKGEYFKLRHENQELRNENLRLRNELENQAVPAFDMPELPHPGHGHFESRGPEFPVEAPVPPPPPSVRRVR